MHWECIPLPLHCREYVKTDAYFNPKCVYQIQQNQAKRPTLI